MMIASLMYHICSTLPYGANITTFQISTFNTSSLPVQLSPGQAHISWSESKRGVTYALRKSEIFWLHFTTDKIITYQSKWLPLSNKIFIQYFNCPYIFGCALFNFIANIWTCTFGEVGNFHNLHVFVSFVWSTVEVPKIYQSLHPTR